MTRSRLASAAGRWGMLWLLLAAGGPAGAQQLRADSAREAPLASVQPDSVAVPAPVVGEVPPSTPLWPVVLGVLGGIVVGALGARLLARRSRRAHFPHRSRHRSGTREEQAPAPEPLERQAPENVPRTPVVQSLRGVQANPPAPSAASKAPDLPQGAGKKSQRKSTKHNQPPSSEPAWPTISHRPAMNSPSPSASATPDDQPLEPGQTVEWAAPTSTPPAIRELIDSTATGEDLPIDDNSRAAALASLEAALPAAASGPVHYYAPAPDVPSIEHRKLSPNPLPQMPLLITLPHAEASTAQFSFSPQADQSRIIGNGVRELKEFFAFELPPTEQFTTIKNLAPGKLEKREDSWYVVQKAGIALS